jgi:ubiquinone/menaquinone biosynthesis C-methylase UbiE
MEDTPSVANATGMAARYDRRAPAYERCWAPILRAPALTLLDFVTVEAARPGAAILDVGTGTGTLAIAAARRFPAVRVTALDVSAAMLALARGAVARDLPGAVDRIDFVEAGIAEAVGSAVQEAAFDAALSSFVLQLVPDRAAALDAILRALRPGGRLAFVTWTGAAPQSTRTAWETAWETALASALAAAGLPAPDIPEPPRSGPIPDPTAAVAELRAAGYVDATASSPPMVHDFGQDGARSVVIDYEEAAMLEQLPGAVAADVVARLDRELAGLPSAAFIWRPAIVMATARRPG